MMQPGPTQTVLEILLHHQLLLCIALVILWLVRNRRYNGLNKYPGPLAASVSNLWRFIDVCKRRPELTLMSLHERHGDVVRIGPGAISFADPAALKTIYGLNNGFVKVSLRFPSPSPSQPLARVVLT